MPIDKSATWHTAIPLPYSDEEHSFWTREAGLLCLGFRELGLDSKMVALGEQGASTQRPAIAGTLQQWHDPAWWKQWAMAGVVLYAWAAPRYEPVARAIKASGARLILRMDSDGMMSPRVWFRRYLYCTYWAFKDDGHFLPGISALLKTLLFYYVHGVYHRGLLEHLSHADLVVIESSVAWQRCRRLLAHLGHASLADRVRVIPPQVSGEFSFDPALPKEPIILAVGRWATGQKDAPTLIKVLGRVLETEREYSAVVAGSGEALLHRLASQLPDSVKARIRIAGRLPHEELGQWYRRSSILFFSSRSEGFPNVACEALCCGCSVVGPAMIASMVDCVEHGSGTLACSRSAANLADALGAEIAAWRSGRRDPKAISRRWWPRVTAPKVAEQMLELVDQMSRGQAPASAAPLARH